MLVHEGVWRAVSQTWWNVRALRPVAPAPPAINQLVIGALPSLQ
jgi:hypothetical protein